MEFNIFKKKLLVFSISIVLIFCFLGCSKKEKSNVSNSFYIELVNFTNDSLKMALSESIFGKVSYYKNNKLEIVSLNYVTEKFPDIHYFKSESEIKDNIKEDTKKIKIEFGGEYSVDSILFSLQKFKYSSGQWIKISDMGFLKATTTYKKAKKNAIKEFSKQILNNTVLYTYE